jgi:2'-phosphotransferase
MPREPRSRASDISHALSRLLRHAAVEEKISIDNHGWVRCDHLLGWKKLRSMNVTMTEVVDVVREGLEGKGRFGLRLVRGGSAEGEEEKGEEGKRDHANEVSAQPNLERLREFEADSASTATKVHMSQVITTPQPTETQQAIIHFTSHPTSPPSFYLIRATQGHSMQHIQPDLLLTPITLSDPSIIPDCVVHGTFYSAWDAIVQSGGLRGMGRNYVHFSLGPAKDEVLSALEGENGGGAVRFSLKELMEKGKVKSGMRPTAELLIYIDIRRALKEKPEMKWYRSENGVILSEGLPSNGDPAAELQKGEQVDGKGKGKGAEETKVVGMDVWDCVVDVGARSESKGVVWQWDVQKKEGKMLKEVPKGRGGGNAGGRGRGGRGRDGRGGRGRGQ